MATAMQQEAIPLNIQTVRRRPEGQSVAERRFRDIISRQVDMDSDLIRYGDMWHEEDQGRAKAAYPSNRWCFAVSVKMGGLWASDLLPLVPAKYPKTRKMLAKIVVDGLLCCKDLDAEAIFGQTLRQWPSDEGKLAGDAIRETLEFRSNNNPSKQIGRFFQFGAACNREVARIMLQAAIKWGSEDLLLTLGKLLFLLIDDQFENDEHFRRKAVLDMLR